MTAILPQTDRPATRRPPLIAGAAPRSGGVALILATRPEIFKLAPVLCRLGRRARVVRPGNHSPSALPNPEFGGGTGTGSRSFRVAGALEQLTRLFAADRPEVVLVHGATDTALAGALAAHSHGIPLVHVEAGLRSHDLALPEERNRVLADRVSDVLCAPTPVEVGNLEAEGLGGRDVRLTGTTTAEAVHHRLMPGPDRINVLRKWGLQPDGYVLATLDRPENTDDEEALFAIANQLSGIADAGYPVVLPVDPRTRAAVIRAGVLASAMNLRVVNRLWHSEFLALAKHAALLVSDSGSVQEEATVLKRPILVVRRSTERPEVLRDFGKLVRPHDDIAGIALNWLTDGVECRARLADTPSPFGDGRSSERIADAVHHLSLLNR
ncbi:MULTISPECIES: UDP-N-acetyl glucosamine 2-epimerase [Amycolatopsis]|uniref:UDP-N-acetyl glucosamine 2-epimerase n=1 Tax=Amycolatopsis TaxID=1813 RepID=UPI000B8B7A90|nr:MULTISPECIES: UDP-N-acetylglucosamine 2-epimerase [Amycolatopsis]OXM75081.1 UDP-N-acetylglucosamine 2-epimerase (non-hydrolyzing) [Amycolatopsis sp. KNN50.9b]